MRFMRKGVPVQLESEVPLEVAQQRKGGTAEAHLKTLKLKEKLSKILKITILKSQF